MAQTLLLVGQNKKEVKIAAEAIAHEGSSNFDILTFDASENKGIETARELLTKSFRKPFNSRFLTLIVLEADNLTIEAQNSLLKLLEEPPVETQIILTTVNRNSLLPTVASRCLEISIKSENRAKSNQSAFENFFRLKLSARLELLEKVGVEQYLEFLRELLHRKIAADAAAFSEDTKKLAEKLRIALKLNRAIKSSANKKLVALLLAQI